MSFQSIGNRLTRMTAVAAANGVNVSMLAKATDATSSNKTKFSS